MGLLRTLRILRRATLGNMFRMRSLAYPTTLDAEVLRIGRWYNTDGTSGNFIEILKDCGDSHMLIHIRRINRHRQALTVCGRIIPRGLFARNEVEPNCIACIRQAMKELGMLDDAKVSIQQKLDNNREYGNVQE